MINKLTILTAAAMMSNFAVAQTTTTTATTVLASADAANVAATSSIATDERTNLKINYEGILNGPRADFADGKRAAFASGSDLYVSNRFRFKTDINENFDASIQARLRTTLKQAGMVGSLENFRLASNIKNLLQTDIGSLTLTPRVVLPTAANSHDTQLMPSPELIAQYSIEPKNSRFSFNSGVQMIKYLYGSSAVASSSQDQFYFLGILESAYQLSPKTKLTAAFYPELTKYSDVAMATSSNELDLGVSFDVSKSWSINPYLATEMNYLSNAKKSAALEATGVMVTVTGSLL